MRTGIVIGVLFVALLAAVIVVIELVRVPDMYAVEGHGSVKYRPDAAKISVDAVARADATADASIEASKRMQKILAALKAAGVADADIATAAIESGPTQQPYREPGSPAARMPNYTAVQSITVTAHDLGKLAGLLDTISAAGPQFWHVDYFVSDQDALNLKARNAALEDAIKRADAYSSGGGFKRGRILKIQEGQTFFPYANYSLRRYITSPAEGAATTDQLLNTLPQVTPPADAAPAPPSPGFQVPKPEEREAQSTVGVLFEIK